MDTKQRGRVDRWCTTSLVLLLCAAPWPSAWTETTFVGVVIEIQREDSKQAMSDLIALANRGDARAQYWLGLAYLEAKWVERNIPQALSWLQIAADGYDGAFATSAADDARQTLLKVGPQVTGSDLIKADQITAAFLTSYNTALAASEKEGRNASQAAASSTSAVSTAADTATGITTGCALDDSQNGCPQAAAQRSARQSDTPRRSPLALDAGPIQRTTRRVHPKGRREFPDDGSPVQIAVHAYRAAIVPDMDST